MSLIEFIFPNQCIMCSKVGKNICENCIKKIPRCPPLCPICGKVSNGYTIHGDCSNNISTGYTGWYISKEIQLKLEEKMRKGIYSTHIYFLNNLLNYLNLWEEFNGSLILPLNSEDRDISKLNTFLSKSISNSKKKNNVIYIGCSWEGREIKDVKKKGSLKKRPSQCKVFTLFRYTTPVPPPVGH